MATMNGLISLDSTTKKITILPGIKDYSINTYQFSVTCKDEFNDPIVSVPFRIFVIDSEF